MKVAAVVPAYNEERRIGVVLSTLTDCDLLDDIVVVDDGSTDRTLDALPAGDGVRGVRLERNVGKGGAMWAGALATDAEVLLFLDADLVGLRREHVKALVEPLMRGEADMSVGTFQGGRYWTDLAQRLAPHISGQRAVRRDLLLTAPEVRHARSGVEVALTHHARMNGWRVKRVTLSGITHVMKEEKMGWLRGVGARLRMYYEIVGYALRLRCTHGALRVARGLRRGARTEHP